MKKILFIFLVLSIAICTSGCIKYDYDLEIKKTGEVIFKETEAINLKTAQNYNKYFPGIIIKKIENRVKLLDEKGIQARKYLEIPYSGTTITRKANTIKNFSSDMLPYGFVTEDSSPIKYKENNFLTTNYKIDLKYDLEKAIEKTARISQGIDYINAIPSSISENYIDNTAAKLTIKIPYKPYKHNATRILEYNTYEWDLAREGVQEINIEYNKYNTSILTIIFTLLLSILGVAYLWVRLKNDYKI